MSVVELDGEGFEAAVAGHAIVLVDFRADWCAPCRLFAPVFELASGNHPDILFGRVDTVAERDLAAAFQVRSIPTLMAFREGIVVFAQAGLMPPPVLEEVIRQVRGLDMAEVRRKMAEFVAREAS
jgi:thioredoxin